jgi:C4-dicarboxylate transporter DctM subunit
VARGTVLASGGAVLAFTAITGGSGVTILALGGLLLPLLRHAGYPEQRSIGLVTSASALGVLLAPSVPLIMYAVMARVPIVDMFLAGLLPAVVMVASACCWWAASCAAANEPMDAPAAGGRRTHLGWARAGLGGEAGNC